MTRYSRVALMALIVALSAVLPSCVKPTTFNPYAAPDTSELDRLQRQINDRPDLEVVQRQLADLDAQIRATIAKSSPSTRLPPSAPLASSVCGDPFSHNIGQSQGIDQVAANPAPTSGSWTAISEDLRPVLTAAGFRANTPPGVTPAPGTFSFIRDDGATIELKYSPGVLLYKYATGCHLPATWRTSAPPPDQRPLNDADVHYPYLYGPPGGRKAPAE
jgi:hypothetical protein